jgi:hypothetical protein
LVFPADLGAGDVLEAAVGSGATAITFEASGFIRPAGLLSLALACSFGLRLGAAITASRARSAAVDSYLEQVGFYQLVVRRGGVVVGTARSRLPLEPLTGLVELSDRRSVGDKVAELSRALVHLRTRRADAERVAQAVSAGLECVPGSGSVLLVAERYADEAGWSRIEVGVGAAEGRLGTPEWKELGQALASWQARVEPRHPGPFGRLVDFALAKGPGSIEVRSGDQTVVASTRLGVSARPASLTAGTRLGLIMNVAVSD